MPVFPPQSVSARGNWYTLKMPHCRVALGFAEAAMIHADTPYPAPGDHLCLELVTEKTDVGFRLMRQALNIPRFKDCMASMKILDNPYTQLCIQFRMSHIAELPGLLGTLFKM